MRYVSAFLFAVAAGAHTGQLVDMLAVGILIFAGTVALCWAIEGIIHEALRPPPTPTACGTPFLRSRRDQ